MPPETIILMPSSTGMSVKQTSVSGKRIRKPEVGFGVVATKTA